MGPWPHPSSSLWPWTKPYMLTLTKDHSSLSAYTPILKELGVPA